MGPRVVINQSNYLPWKGYFDLIHDADIFVFYDDLQFTKNDWRNRNRLKTPRGPAWLTIPVGKDIHRLICDVTLPANDWAREHWRTIEQNYRATPHFSRYAPVIQDALLGRAWRTLSDVNQHLIKVIARDILGITTTFADSRDYVLRERSQGRVLELLGALGSTTYISGPAAKAYIDETRFGATGIELIWKDYSGYPEYDQPYPPFEHAVSVLDLIFSTGPDAPEFIWGWRASTVPRT